MKMPHWLVVSLLTLSMLAVLGFAGSWWVTWPERTARKYVSLVSDQDIDTAFEISAGDKPEVLFAFHELLPTWRRSDLQMDSRKVADLLYGRRHFQIAGYEFTVQRGVLIDQGFRKRGIVLMTELDL